MGGNAGTWSLAAAARYGHCSCFDPTRHQTIVFSGGTTTGVIADLWCWDGVVWTSLGTPPGPGGRYLAGMTWDRERQRAVLFGGSDGIPTFPNTTWEWDTCLLAWLLRPTPTASPSGRDGLMAFDEARSQSLIFSGAAGLTDSWVYEATCHSSVVQTGSGCPNAATGLTPDVSVATCSGPWIGGPLRLEVTNLPPSSVSVIFLDGAPLSIPLPGGCNLYTGPGIWSFLSPPTGYWPPLSGPPFAIPNMMALCGALLNAQSVSIDPTVPLLGPGFITAMSNGLQITIGTR